VMTGGPGILAPADGGMMGGAGRPEPVMVGMEKEVGTRMAGMTSEPEPTPDEEEALRLPRMILEERLRSVPQPPLLDPGRDRRMRKSL
jgi:hypothetical protein